MVKEETIGSRLRAARKFRKITQEALAEKLHFTGSTICHYENGDLEIGCSTLKLLAKELDVAPGYFFGDVPLAYAIGLQSENTLDEDIAASVAILSSIEKAEVRKVALMIMRNLMEL